MTLVERAADAAQNLANAIADANTEKGKVATAQTNYTTAGGDEEDAVYTAVTDAETALDEALAEDPQVTADIVAATEDLESAIEALDAATLVLTNAAGAEADLIADVNAAKGDELALWDALVAAGVVGLDQDNISEYNSTLAGTEDSIKAIQDIVTQVNVLKPIVAAGDNLALRTALLDGGIENVLTANIGAYDTALTNATVALTTTIEEVQEIIDLTNNEEDVDSIKALLETAGTFAAVDQADVNTEPEAKAAVEAVIAELDLKGVTATVEPIAVTPFQAATAETSVGAGDQANGFYKFTVNLVKGTDALEVDVDTSEIELVITGTEL